MKSYGFGVGIGFTAGSIDVCVNVKSSNFGFRELLDAMDGDDRFGEFMEVMKNKLLDPNETNPAKRAAGLFAWQ